MKLENLVREREPLALSALLNDPARVGRLRHSCGGVTLDLTHQLLDVAVLEALLELYHQSDIDGKKEALFAGEALNQTEGRAVGHIAARTLAGQAALEPVLAFARTLRREKRFKDVLVLGIGGSHLGPALCLEALQEADVSWGGPEQPWQEKQTNTSEATSPRIHFLSSLDPETLETRLRRCDPHTSYCLVVSKSFTTLETAQNAARVRSWLENAACNPDQHMGAISSMPERAQAFQKIFTFDETIGGRTSLWSAVGLPIMLGAGPEAFQDLLEGARTMDHHFQTEPPERNLPVLMGLVAVWNRNFLNIPARALVPYGARLALLPAWAQQLEMESNGKSVTRTGEAVAWHTAPVLFGGTGPETQHSFFQHLHQGTQPVATEFILPLRPDLMRARDAWDALPAEKQAREQIRTRTRQAAERYEHLVASVLAQCEALALGETRPNAPHQTLGGNKPSSLILLERLSARHLGALLAMYEHATIVSGFLWDINSFDQWGVELGKKMARRYHTSLRAKKLESFQSLAMQQVLQGHIFPSGSNGDKQVKTRENE